MPSSRRKWTAYVSAAFAHEWSKLRARTRDRADVSAAAKLTSRTADPRALAILKRVIQIVAAAFATPEILAIRPIPAIVAGGRENKWRSQDFQRRQLPWNKLQVEAKRRDKWFKEIETFSD
jgi:hypothetical protein